MTLESLVEEYLRYLSGVRNFSPETIRGYQSDLSQWLSFVNENCVVWSEISESIARSYLSLLFAQKKAPATTKRHLAAIRGVYRFAEKREYIDYSPFAGVRGPKERRKLPEFLTQQEFEELLVSCGSGFGGVRNRLILELFFSTGCRVSEGCALSARECENEEILIRGKGGKERFLFLGESARKTMKEYLAARKLRRRVDHDYLLINLRGGALTPRGVFYVLRQIGGISPVMKPLAPHMLRHAFATEILNGGADIREVQELLGHSSLSTTQIYTHVGIERLKPLIRRAHPHGRRNALEKSKEL